MSEFTPISELTLAIPGAGRRTLLAALPGDLACPENLRLCVLDATRMDAPAQIALLDELAAQPGLEILFALNKADRPGTLRTAVNGARALLRERGFAQPRIWPICAGAARLFGLSPADRDLPPKKITAQAEYFARFAPGENSLSALAVTDTEGVCLLDGRQVSPEQLHLALINTGVPALEAALRAAGGMQNAKCKMQNEGTGNREQGTGDEDQGPGIKEQGTGDEDQGPGIKEQGTGNREQGTGDEGMDPSTPLRSAQDDTPATPAPEDVGAHSVRPPEAETSAPAAPAPTDPLEDKIDALLDALDEGEAPAPEPEIDLAPLLALVEQADCAALLEMARSVQNGEEPPAYREQALDAIHAAYQAREREELETLTQGVDELDLPTLRALAERINTGAYTVQARTPYAQRINARIDVLMNRELTELCAGVEEADAQTLAQIRKGVDRADCADVLKTEYYQRIEERQDRLDLENLERITAGAETMTEKELRTVAVTLEANNWNPKYITAFRHKIALCLETSVFSELEQELTELNDMERREVLALRERIAGKELPPRFTAAPLAEIDEKLYRMDMLRLMALNNDFDLLDFEGLDALRGQVGRGDFTDRARAEYLGRLREREEALVVENTDARAQLVRQLIGQYKLRMADFVFASRSEAYQQRLDAYWGGSGMEQPRDVPVFLFDNGSDYALTSERFYYKVGKELAFLPLANIERFQTMRQHMSLILQVVGKDNSYLLTGAKISRSGAERTIDFLNDCVRRWHDPELVGARSASPIRTRRFETSAYTAPVETRLPDPALALELFRRRYDGERIREGTLFRPGEDWEQRTARLLASFGLPENTPLVWFVTSGLLGSIREGVAVGPRAIYWKDSQLPVQTIPLEQIYAIERSGKQLTVTTLRGQVFRPEMPAVMVPLVEDYVRTIQLGIYLRSRENADG